MNEQDKAAEQVRVDRAMELAQVFASAWSLIGGRFDFGDGMELAEEAKEELRKFLQSAPVTPAAEQQTYAWPKPISEEEARAAIQELQAATLPAQDAREAFETRGILRGLPLAKQEMPGGDYASVVTQEAWEAWQARAALSQQDSGGADMFWNAADPEQCAESVHEVIDREYGNGSVAIGDTMAIQRAIRLPDIQVRIVVAEDDADDWDYEVIAAARQQSDSKGGSDAN